MKCSHCKTDVHPVQTLTLCGACESLLAFAEQTKARMKGASKTLTAWDLFAAVALMRGASPRGAADRADEMMKHIEKRRT